MKKKIGIVGWMTGANSFGVTSMYLDYFSNFGTVEIITHRETEVRNLDLLVLPGGPDVDPMRYLKEDDDLSIFNGKPCVFKERFDKVLLPKYVANNTPIFGICRGHQSLAVFFGGKLIQEMWEEGLNHEQNKAEERMALVHYCKPTIYANKYTTSTFQVNSMHHQCVNVENLPETATPLAYYSNKAGTQIGAIEALTYFPHYPAHTVQWHPEEIRDDFSTNLIDELLNL